MAVSGLEETGSDRWRRLARRVTDVFAPAWMVIGLPPVVGFLASGRTGAAWGVLAAVSCGALPALLLFAGVRLGWFSDWHVRRREERPKFVAVTAVLVVGTLVALTAVGAPRLMIACVASMLAGLAVVGPVTLAWKISFHTAVVAGAVVVLATVLPAVPVYATGAAVVAVVGWSRVVLDDHTPAQVAVGAVVGGAVTWATLTALL